MTFPEVVVVRPGTTPSGWGIGLIQVRAARWAFRTMTPCCGALTTSNSSGIICSLCDKSWTEYENTGKAALNNNIEVDTFYTKLKIGTLNRWVARILETPNCEKTIVDVEVLIDGLTL